MTHSVTINYPRQLKSAVGFFIISILGIGTSCFAAQSAEQPNIAANEIQANDAGISPKVIDAILARNYSGIDTAAVLSQLQKQLQWGEENEKLIEAQGIIYWDKGDGLHALPLFLRLSHPGPLTMGQMGECFLKKGERYEAADWFIKSARSFSLESDKALSLFRQALDIKPDQGQIELEFASRLEAQNHFSEAWDIYSRHMPEILADTLVTLRIGARLHEQGREKDALTLYNSALELHPDSKSLWIRKAESQDLKLPGQESAQTWIKVWSLDQADTLARNHAILGLEAAGQPAEGMLQSLLQKALAMDAASGPLHFKLATLYLRTGQRDVAFEHLKQALQASPANHLYMSKISEAIESDSLILAYFPYLISQAQWSEAPKRLLQQVAHGFGLKGESLASCRFWLQAFKASPQGLDGNHDAFMELSACPDSTSLAMAEKLGESIVAGNGDRETLKAFGRVSLSNQSFGNSAANAIRLVKVFPEEAPTALATAKSILNAHDSVNAKEVLTALVTQTELPEASMLLGQILVTQKNFDEAAEQFELAMIEFPEAEKRLAECLVEMKDLKNAARVYGSHFSRTGEKESLRSAARLYGRLGDISREKSTLEILVQKAPVDENDKLHLGIAQISLGDTAKALAGFNDILLSRNTIPNDSLWSRAALILGSQMVHEGRFDRAIKLLNLGLFAAPTSLANRGEIWLQIGACQAEKKQWKNAYFSYSQGMAADPYSVALLRGQLESARKLGLKNELQMAHQALYHLDSLDEEANSFLGQMHQRNREYPEAAQHYRRLTTLHPQDAKAWENLGNALAMIPNLRAATRPLQTAIDLGAESDETYINRARAYRAEASKEMAASILDFILTRNAKSYLGVLWAGKFAEEDGNQQLAMEMFKKAAKLSTPHSPWPELGNQGLLEANVSISH